VRERPAHPEALTHGVDAMRRLRMFAIAAGYEDADDCDSPRDDPMFKMAVGRLPESGDPLCSQPMISRLDAAHPIAREHQARMLAPIPTGLVVDLETGGLIGRSALLSAWRERGRERQLFAGDPRAQGSVRHGTPRESATHTLATDPGPRHDLPHT